MKKILSVSLIAAIAVVGDAFAAERDTRMSDIVRLLEDNPEMMAEVESDITARAALKVPTTKVVNLKNTTTAIPATNGLYNTKIANPGLGGFNSGTIGGGNSTVQSGYYDDNGHYIPEIPGDVEVLMGSLRHLCNDTTIKAARAVVSDMKARKKKIRPPRQNCPPRWKPQLQIAQNKNI